mmetsp:Transcript_6546/g.16723  ORF Transcript_6546/g.16723 Transcript_6546/m.16723 type:complete len:137 (-) Transcript_6546:811-1221(-)
MDGAWVMSPVPCLLLSSCVYRPRWGSHQFVTGGLTSAAREGCSLGSGTRKERAAVSSASSFGSARRLCCAEFRLKAIAAARTALPVVLECGVDSSVEGEAIGFVLAPDGGDSESQARLGERAGWGEGDVAPLSGSE